MVTHALTRLAAEIDQHEDGVSIWWGSADGTPWFTRFPDLGHYAASTMKLAVLVAAYLAAETQRVDLGAPVEVHNRFASALDGSPYAVDRTEDSDDEVWAALGSRRPLRWLAQRMIVRSSNLATNLVLDTVGAPAVAEVMQACGATGSTVSRGIEDYRARDAGIDNVVTAGDLAAMWCALASGKAAGDAATAEMLDLLADNEWNDGIPAGLPPDTRVCHKNGWQDRVCHDAALIMADDRAPSVLVVLTTTDLDNAAANALTARIAAAAWADQGEPRAGQEDLP